MVTESMFLPLGTKVHPNWLMRYFCYSLQRKMSNPLINPHEFMQL